MSFRIDDTSGSAIGKLTDSTTGTLDPVNLFIVSGVGGGKSLCLEQFMRYFYDHGYTIISLSDVKDNIEQGFTMFEPTSNYHLKQISLFGCPKYAQPTKIYHPLTFNIPKGEELPEINFYGINIKSITETDLKFLAESNENKRSVQIIMETIDKLKSDEGLHHLIFKSEEQTESLINSNKTGIKYRSDKADDFFTKTKMGTEKTASEMIAYFKPFVKDYSILPKNNPHNINIRELINDQKHYHLFTTKWIKSPRLKAFYILHLLQEIISNEQYAKHPICTILEEIRFLTPQSSSGFSPHLAEEIKSTMTRMRNMGKGYAILSTTQVYKDTSSVVVDSFNETIFGRIPSIHEQEYIGKALKLSSTDMKTIQNLDTGEFALYTREENSDEKTLQKVRFFMPPHSHKDQRQDFFSKYAETYPDKMRTYDSLLDELQAEKTRIEEDVTVLKDKENLSKREQAKKIVESKISKVKDKETEEKLEKQKEKTKKTSDALKQLIISTYNSAVGREKEYGAIALKCGLFLNDGKTPNKMMVFRTIKRWKEEQENPSTETEEEPEEIELEEESDV